MSKIKEGERYFSQSQLDKIAHTVADVFQYYPMEQVDGVLIPYLIKYLFNENVNIEDTVLIVGEIKNGDTTLYEKQIEDIYNQKVSNTGKAGLAMELSEKQLQTIEQTVEPQKWDNVIVCDISDKSSFRVNFKSRNVSLITNISDNKQSSNLILDCVPKELIVYDAVLLDQPRSFKIKWTSHVSDRIFTTDGEAGGATVREIVDYLNNAGFVMNTKHAQNCVTSIINQFIRQDMAILQKDIDNPGFYYDVEHDSIIAIKKDITEPTSKQLNNAVDVLEELAQHFKGNETLLATVLKWGMMSQFAYAKKQVGKWLPYLYLKGSAGSGKTTLAKLVLYMYGGPTTDNNIGGSGFDTLARIGAKLSKSCDPILVNEPAGAFNRPSVVELIKVSVESTTSRGKMMGGSYRQIPAFSPVMFTANQYLPEDDALLRRFYTLSFSYSMRKNEAEKAAFERTFHMDNPTISPLKHLEHLARFTVNEVIANPSLLMDDWKEVTNNIIRNLYGDIGKTVPEWLLSWEESESLEDFDNNQTEDIRIFFNDAFNQAKRKVTFRDENGSITSYDVDSAVSDGSDFEEVNWQIVNNRLLDWAIPKVSRNGTRYVCFTQGLRKAISERIDFCSDLKSIGELLGWKYQSAKFNGKVKKVVKVKFDDFLEFLYPSLQFDEVEFDEVT